MSERASRAAPTVASGLVLALLLFARRAGLPQQALDGLLGAHAGAVDDPEQRLPSRLYGELLDGCVRLSGDASFPTRLGAASRVAHLGLLGVALQASPGLGEALRAYARWQRVLGESLQVELGLRGRQAWLSLRAQDEFAGRPARLCSMVAGIHAVCSELAGRAIPWTAVHLDPDAASTPAAAALARLLAVPLTPGDNRLCMDAAVLDWPVQHGLADPVLLGVLQQRLVERESALGVVTTAARVEAWLRRHLGQCARPSLSDAALSLHLSPRALQHRLQQEGVGFRALADRVAEDAAKAWLRHGQRGAAVAHALGFADERAFARAFLRWTRSTPAQYVRAGGAAAG